MMKYDLKDQK